MDECVFCKIAGGRLKAHIVYESADVLAFRDINPQAPVHVLVVPKKHVGSLLELNEIDASILRAIHEAVLAVANKENVAQSGFRIVVNTGRNGGQTVGHLHVHVLGGRFMNWPPG